MENEKYFCDLDAVVGDGDFGYSLARGFGKLLEDWDAMEYDDVAGLLKKTAIVLSSRIGGTSGPIWGTAFLRAGGALNGKPEPTGDDVIAALRAAIEGIKQRGNADVGDKTLLDALVPAVDSSRPSSPAARPPATRWRPRRPPPARAPRRRRACSPSAAGRPTRGSAAASRSTPARSAWP